MQQPVETPGPGRAEQPFYLRASFWVGPFMWMLGAVVATALAIGWYALGGFPRDHDKYGEVPVPGIAVLELPEGDVRVNFENSAHRSGDSTTLDDQPPGLAVTVAPAGGGEPVEVEDVPSWIFSSTSGDRGHEPYGKIELPSEGRYLVVASADGQPAPPPLKPTAAAAAEPPRVDSGAALSLGAAPWNPLDSKFLGAVLVFVAVMLVILAFTLPFRLFMGRR
ncbi:MAG TPA: hypothetical protein VFL56_02040 [Solirubrobacterales bacterium]|nr:hypothetical protein [Solirubrobacterales bacterium]